MIATGIISGIVLLMVMVYSGVSQSWLNIDQRTQLNQNVRMTATRISREVRMAVKINTPGREELGSSLLRFVGSDNLEVRYEFDSEEGLIYRNDVPIAGLITQFTVDRELRCIDEEDHTVRTDILTITIQASHGGQTHAVKQQVKLRNIN